jgi:uncharacterized protein YjiS (DUF1127 family)
MSKPFRTLATPLRCTFNAFSSYMERRRGAADLRNLDKTFLRDTGLSQTGIDDLRRVFF